MFDIFDVMTKLSDYMDYYIERLAWNHKPTFFEYNNDWNKGTTNPHAKDGWHGISKPHGKFVTVKYLNLDCPIKTFEEWLSI